MALLICSAQLSCLSVEVSGAETVFPAEHWQTKAPAELGLSAALLDEVATALGSRGCVIKDGYVVKTWGSQSEKSDVFSSAKPVLSTLLFFAIQEGKVRSVDQPIADFGWDLLPKDRTMKFRHLASMTSGYARPEEPGQAWAYNDYAIQLYQKTLFDKVFQGVPEEVFHDPQRFGALGLEDRFSFRKSNRRMIASVRDFARIAWLWLNHGRWGDKQLLPAAYFDEYMHPSVPKDLPVSVDAATNDYLGIGSYGGESKHGSNFGAGIYGFNWWFNDTGRDHMDRRTWPDAPPDAFMSLGHRGNCSLIIPSLKLVVVAAEADWGQIEPGKSDCVMNERLKLIVAAATPAATPDQ
ncbi:MAG TPA: serine hydrolase [Pirellulales bacterium]|jgi:CubicO group peptidase (beta-lactamase class C family)